MTIRSKFLTLLTVAAVSGCHDKASDDRQAKPAAQVVELPYLTGRDGARFPYFEYKSDQFSWWDAGENELAVFVYPIFESRAKGLALPHTPTQDLEGLFCCGELLGRDFSVAVERGVLLVDEIPVSRPIDLNAGSKWKMTYAGAAFDCRVARQIGGDFIIECASNKVVLNLRFNNDRGFTSYQDLCGKEVCTYNLESSVGLLSPYHLRLLTEPSETGIKADEGNYRSH